MKQVKHVMCSKNLKHILEADPTPSVWQWQQKIKVGQQFAIATAICRQASAVAFHLFENKTLGIPL